MDFKDLYSDTLDKCVENGLSFRILPKRTHQGTAGWVCEDEFLVCSKRSDFLDVFVHESCHVDQLLEKDSIWYDKALADGMDIWDTDFGAKHPRKWLNGWKKTVELELDCENRALEKIKKYKLKIDNQDYICRANCYTASYFYFHKYKCFYHPKNTPYRHAGLISMFPSDKVYTLEEAWRPRKELGDFIKQNNKPL